MSHLQVASMGAIPDGWLGVDGRALDQTAARWHSSGRALLWRKQHKRALNMRLKNSLTVTSNRIYLNCSLDTA